MVDRLAAMVVNRADTGNLLTDSDQVRARLGATQSVVNKRKARILSKTKKEIMKIKFGKAFSPLFPLGRWGLSRVLIGEVKWHGSPDRGGTNGVSGKKAEEKLLRQVQR